MADNLIPLVPADLNRLGMQVITRLHEIFFFSEGNFWSISDHIDGLPPARLSERQRQRASQALAEGKGFWDRIGQQVLIPIRERDLSTAPDRLITIGTLVLSKIDHSIGPEEANRWLPILQSWVENQLRILRLEASIARPGEIPLYVYLALEAFSKDRKSPASLLHIVEGHSTRTNSPDHIIEICSMSWGHSDSEWLGKNSRDSWILLPETDGEKLSCGIKRLIPLARSNKLHISRAYGHLIPESFDVRQAKKDIDDLEKLAKELGTAFFCTYDLKVLEGRLRLDGLRLKLDQVRRAIKGGSRCAIAYVMPVPHGLKEGLGQDTISISAGTESAFLVKKIDRKAKDSDLPQWANKVQGLCVAIQGRPSTIGIAASNQPLTGPYKAPVAALWAFMHADLLGKGSLAVHDSLTWNVRGDEILSWGDIRGACREYRLGLRVDPSNANLLNSLGVCLAELGRTKEAIEVFSRAAEASPQDFMTHYNLGGAYLQRGDLKSAEEALKEAYRLNPEDVRTASRMAEVLIESDQAREALEILEPLVKRHGQPSSGAVFRILGKAYRALDCWQEAKTAWQQAIKNNPGDSESMALLALGYLEETNDRETAIRLGQQAKALGGKSKQIRSVICRLNKKLK